jgi:hypothetical protein
VLTCDVTKLCMVKQGVESDMSVKCLFQRTSVQKSGIENSCVIIITDKARANGGGR